MLQDYKDKTIVFFGDSVTDTCKIFHPDHKYGAGYVSMVKTELDVTYQDLNIKVYNEGIGGHKTEDLIARFDQDVKTKNPNIVFVQLESFIDPTLIKEAKFSQDPIPNFRKLSQESLSGNINVPVTGGGTARTEFEVLTGNNFDYLIPGGIPYDRFVKE